jgi:ribosomal protein S15
MPPRIPVPSCLRASSSPSAFSLPLRPFSTSGPLQKKLTSLERKQRFEHDPYVAAQKARKKAANLSRRAELEQSRVESLGNPVRGVSTPFVQSFDTGRPSATAASTVAADAQLNYRFDPQSIESQLEKSQRLAVPLAEISTKQADPKYPWSDAMRHNKNASNILLTAEEIEAQTNKEHARAAEAIRRITALENGSSKDRMRVNITRCIETFGRHNTDKVLPPRAPHLNNINSDAPPAVRPETNVAATGKRIGPDTGSSEVQIAILTAKIKTLADFLATRGKGDKHNKRNLRLLVHRRQKLLQYLRRRERGGPRWQHCIETLGLTEGTWKGEISL